MIVRDLEQAEKSNPRIVSPEGNRESVRMHPGDDNVGFSFPKTTVFE